MDSPVEHDVGAIGDRQGLANIVVGDQHPQPPALQVSDDALDVVYRDRVDPGERLIQKHELRIGHQRTRDFQTPALTTGKRVRLALA